MLVSHALSVILLWNAYFIVINHGFSRNFAYQPFSSSLNAATKKLISPTFYKRAIEGKVSARELDRLFMPDKKEYERINRSSTKGFAGVVFCLDTVLISMTDVYFQAYTVIANQLGYDEIDEKALLDCIGLPFRDTLTSLQWKLEKEDIPAFEFHFFTAIDQIISKNEILAQESAVELLDQVISDGNDVGVVTHLPRDLAIKLLTKTGLKRYLEGRIEANRLICTPDMAILRKNLDSGAYRKVVSEYDDYDVFFNPISGDRYRGRQLLTACSLMQKVPVLVLTIERNRQNILSARRAGLNCIALRGYATSSAYLRAANRIVDDTDQVKMDDIYTVIRKGLEGAMGPSMQPSNQMMMQRKRIVKVIAPPVEQDPSNGGRKRGYGGKNVDFLDPFAATPTTPADADNNNYNSNNDEYGVDDYLEEEYGESEENIDYSSLFGPGIDDEKYFKTAIISEPPSPSQQQPQTKPIIPTGNNNDRQNDNKIEPRKEEEQDEYDDYDDDVEDDSDEEDDDIMGWR